MFVLVSMLFFGNENSKLLFLEFDNVFCISYKECFVEFLDIFDINGFVCFMVREKIMIGEVEL